MNPIINKYQYEISDRLGVIQQAPLGESDFKLEWQRNDGVELFYKKTLPNKIKFLGAAYDNLYKLEGSIYRCEEINISINRKCMSAGQENWITWFTGTFSLNEASWDLDRCEVELKLDEVSESKCIQDKKSDSINLFQYVNNRYVVKSQPPNVTIRKITASKSGSSSDPFIPIQAWDASAGYGPDPAAVGFAVYKNNYTNNGTTYNTYSQWARYEMQISCADPAPGVGWILIGDDCGFDFTRTYASPVSLYDCVYGTPAPPSDGEYMDCKIIGDTSQISEFKNGMKLSDVLVAIINLLCPGKTVVSNFFQINPIIVSATNYVTGLESKTNNLFVFQKSDVKRPNAISATQANVSPDKLLNAICLMFNARWRMSGNTFRIEHISFFGGNLGLDLTTGIFTKFINEMRRYSYNTPEIPERENFLFMESELGSDFEGRPIIYSGGCVSKGNEDNVENYTTEIVTTDVELCVSQSASDSAIVSDAGLVIMATKTDGTDYFIITEGGILSGESKLNNSLAWAQLHRDYHRYYRPLNTGNMNDVETIFFTVKPTKKGDTLTIPLCCGVDFNPDDLITTPLGIGVVDKATYNFKNEMLELDLLYDATAGLENNIAPVANNDVVSIYQDTVAVIDILDNDVETTGTIISVQIVTPPAHGTINVLIDLRVVYTPNAGYVGDDYFNYRVYDSWNEPSNTALVAIHVFATNTPPIANDDFYNATMNVVLNIPAPGVLANDSDNIGMHISSYDHTSVAGGTVVLNSNGSFSYTPVSSVYYGNDTFTYTIMDDDMLTDTATVHINVRNPNFPIANPDYYETIIDTPISPADSVLINDYNPIAGILTATPGTFSTAGGGSVTIGSTGAFTYTPLSGFTGQDSFTYTVHNTAGTDTGTAYIEVFPLLFLRVDKLGDQIFPVTNICGGVPVSGGTRKTADFLVNFFLDSGATIPYNSTGKRLRVYIKHGVKNDPSDPYTYDTYELEEVTGTAYTFEPGRQYFLNTHDCANVPIFYVDETFALDTGLYTII